MILISKKVNGYLKCLVSIYKDVSTIQMKKPSCYIFTIEDFYSNNLIYENVMKKRYFTIIQAMCGKKQLSKNKSISFV